MTFSFKFACCLALAALATPSQAASGTVLIDFDDLPSGTVLGGQYDRLGVSFRANPMTGGGSSSSTAEWAGNTDITVLAMDALGDEAGLAPGPFGLGQVLRSYDAWLDEDGDPSIEALFARPVSSFSASFLGVSTDPGAAADTRLFAFSGDTLLGTARGDGQVAAAEFRLTIAMPGITRVVIAPGSYNDWVAVDNIGFDVTSPVPEPGVWPLMLAGMAALALVRARRQHAALDQH